MTAVMAILGRVPLWAWAVAALVAWGGWHRWQAIDARRDFEQAKTAAAAERAASAAEVAAETNRRLAAIQKEADHATTQALAARADADAARTAEQRLRARLAAVQARARTADSAVASGSAPAGQATDVLADVLGQCIGRVRSLAEYADAARIAGEACERSYYSLIPKGNQ